MTQGDVMSAIGRICFFQNRTAVVRGGRRVHSCPRLVFVSFALFVVSQTVGVLSVRLSGNLTLPEIASTR
jgi:hypothetical protein